MRARLAIAAALALAVGLIAIIVRLFGIQLAAGEVYPYYSSLRSDPFGSKLLFDSLRALPELRVERNYAPLEYLPESGATILFLGSSPRTAADDRSALERAASRGDRVVVAFRIAAPKPEDLKAVADAWGVRLEAADAKGTGRRFYFGESHGWTAIGGAGPKTAVIERAFGKGSVALFAGSEDFSNQSSAAGDRLEQVTSALGANSHIVFDEQHLGIAEGGSIMQMARRFRLTGLMAGLALAAALLLWRNASGFPPGSSAGHTVGQLAGRTSQAGLVTLLRRHIAPRELAPACWQEWLNGNRGQVAPARAALAAEAARAHADRPLEAMREVAGILRMRANGKGEL